MTSLLDPRDIDSVVATAMRRVRARAHADAVAAIEREDEERRQRQGEMREAYERDRCGWSTVRWCPCCGRPQDMTGWWPTPSGMLVPPIDYSGYGRES